MMRAKPKRKLYWGLVVSGGLWAAAGAAIWMTTPGNWWWEIGVISMINLAVFLTIANLTRKPKWGVIIVLIIVGGLTLNRLGLWNTTTGGALLVVAGLLSLIE